jgi:AraC-like DNA-binding protein
MKSALQLVFHSSMVEHIQHAPGIPAGFFHALSFCKAYWHQLSTGKITVQEVSGTDYAIWQWNIQQKETLTCYVEVEEGCIVLLQIIEAKEDVLMIGEQQLFLISKTCLLLYMPAGKHLFTINGSTCFLILLQPPFSFLEGLKNDVQDINELLRYFLQQQKQAYQLPALPMLPDSWMRLKRLDVPALQQRIPDLKLRSYIIDVLHEYGKAAKQQSTAHLQYATTKQKARLVKEFLEQQVFDQELPTLTALAYKFYTQPRTLTKAFQQLTGQTIPQFILEKRLTTAYELTTQSTLPVMEIAFRCGFNDVSHFIRSFKKRYGKTPGVLRKVQ